MEQKGRKFPNSLKKYRKIYGYSQQQVAQLIGHKSKTKISNYENGIVVPSLKIMMKLSLIFRTLPQELFPHMFQKMRKEISKAEIKLQQQLSKKK